MDYSEIKKFEYKAPSYELVNRSNTIDFDDHREKRRYYYDAQSGCFKSKAPEKNSISMLFAGDLLCQEKMLERYETLEGGFDFSLCFEFVKPLLQSVDFTAGNLETGVSQTAPYRGEILTHEGPYFCNAPVEYMAALSDAGFDLLTTENNHTLDAGVRGLMETIDNTKKFGFMQTGTFTQQQEKFVVVDICGFKVGFTAFGVGAYNSMQQNLTQEGLDTLLNSYSVTHAEAILKAMKEKGAEYTVCFPHWGKEYTSVLTKKQLATAKELTGMGFDFVAGSHAHVIQKFKLVNGKPVVYSLGNLITHLNSIGKDASDLTVFCHLKLERDGTKIIPTVEFVPCKIVKNYKGIPFTVLPVSEELELTGEQETVLNNVVKRVTNRLGCKASRIAASLPLDPSAVSAFQSKANSRKVRLEKLCAVKKISVDPVPLVIPTKRFWEKNIRYQQDQNSLYRIFSNHAELIQLGNPAEVIRLPTEVAGVPVRKICGSHKPNTTARLVYLSKQATQVGKAAFRDYTQLESVRLFSHLLVIDEYAFAGCEKMTGMILPRNLTTVGKKAFMNCSNLLSIKIPSSVAYIGKNAFKGCNKLTIYCEEGSAADHYARKQGIPVQYMPLEASDASAELVGHFVGKKKDEFAKFFERKPAKRRFVSAANTSSNVVMGPMNGPNDKHPVSIIATCFHLGKPLPRHAKCGNQPSYYIGNKSFDGTLDTIKKLLGEKMPAIAPEELARVHRLFRSKYKTQKILDFNTTDLTVYFCDWILFARDRGFSLNCYFDYELYNKEPEVRDTFLNEGYRQRIYEACNKVGFRKVFLDKAKFNSKFKKFVKRDWVDASVCSFEEFCAFAEKHERFFGKPVRGTGGKGAHVVERDSDTLENLFAMCQEEGLILEEIIKQHPSLAEFNDSTLNTVRVNTMLCADDEVRILLTVARFGRAGNAVDNFHGGGVGAIVDIDTGVIITEAINQAHMRSPIHPDSRKQILGFQYPEWEKVKAAVCEAAWMTPKVRQVGWDVAVTEDGRVEFVEGNSRPNFDVLQSPDQLGRRFRYAPFLPEIEKLEGINYQEPEPLVIDITGMESD